MNWLEFLNAASVHEELTLVGPMHRQRHDPKAPTIYVDGGARWAPETSGWPSVRVGDGDSAVKIELDERLPMDKDHSDFSFALRSLPEKVSRLELLGFLGGRRDHELANLGEAHAFLRTRRKLTVMSFDDQIFAFSGGAWSRNIFGLFSIFTLSPTRVKITGACRYTILSPQEMQPFSSLGLSNEGHGRVQIEGDGPIFVLLPWMRETLAEI